MTPPIKGVPPYAKVAKEFGDAANAPDPWNIVNFGTMLSTIRFLNRSQSKYGVAARSRRRGCWRPPRRSRARRRSAPRRCDCGRLKDAPAVCNERAQFFTYQGKNVFNKSAGWLQAAKVSR